jgi:uncharacterized protein YlxW (UPF0749 family)
MADDDRDDIDFEEPEAREAPVRTKVSAAGAMIGLLVALLGFALVVQVQSHATDADLAGTRPEDLVRILSDLESQQERLEAEISDLEESRRQLASGALGREAALAEARRRADALGILAGTLPAEGPGLEITFTRTTERVRPETILDAVEELRGAGAEALQISGANGTSVRIVASTYFVGDGDNLVVDRQQLTAPYTILAIGEPQTMHTALNIPGGVVDAARQHGGTVSVQEREVLRVTALHSAAPPRYARPIS